MNLDRPLTLLILPMLLGGSFLQGRAQAGPARPMQSTPDCTSAVATDAKPVDCIIYRPAYFRNSDGHIFMGVCIYLGANIPSLWSNVLNYNWVQKYETNSDLDDQKHCGNGRAHTDPCPDKDPLYRPGDEATPFTGSSARTWGMSHIFRDKPTRDLTDLASRKLHRDPSRHKSDPGDFYWKATLDFVRVKAFSADTDYVRIERASYGFTIRNSVLTLDPLIIDGSQVAQGQTRSLKDPPEVWDPSDMPRNVCIRDNAFLKKLEPPPDDLRPTQSRR